MRPTAASREAKCELWHFIPAEFFDKVGTETNSNVFIFAARAHMSSPSKRLAITQPVRSVLRALLTLAVLPAFVLFERWRPLRSERESRLRRIARNLGVAAFYDGGNVYPRIGFHKFIADYTNTVGFGIRYQTPVGPIRLDIGHNLNATPGIKATQVFITIGQAF